MEELKVHGVEGRGVRSRVHVTDNKQERRGDREGGGRMSNGRYDFNAAEDAPRVSLSEPWHTQVCHEPCLLHLLVGSNASMRKRRLLHHY